MMKTIFPALIASALGGSLTCCDKPNRQSVEIDTPQEVEAAARLGPEHADSHFKDAMTEKVFQDYLRLRTALARQDADEAAEAADDMEETFGAERSDLKQLAAAISAAGDLELQRGGFARLSREIRPLFPEGLSGGTIHVMFCPEAREGAGAIWIPDAEETINPYLGPETSGCGEIRETLSPKLP